MGRLLILSELLNAGRRQSFANSCFRYDGGYRVRVSCSNCSIEPNMEAGLFAVLGRSDVLLRIISWARSSYTD